MPTPPLGKPSRLSAHFRAALIATSAVAGAAANAGVIYYEPNWVIPANIDGLYINVETQATGSAGSGVAGWDLNPYNATSITWFNATGTGMLRYPGVTTGSAGNLSLATPVNATGSYGSGAVTFGAAAGNWQYNAANRFGFRFTGGDGLTHYGWGEMTVGASAATRTITKIGYESSAEAPINVGDTGGGPPPYDACAATNPTANLGANILYMNTNGAPNIAVAGGCSFTLYKANTYAFTAPVNGTYTFDTCASGLDTRMALLTGCSGGTVLGCNENFCGLSSSVTISMTAGQVAYVAIGSASASTGLPSPVAMTVTPPAVPDCTNAMTLSFGANSYDTAGQTYDQVVSSTTTGGTTVIYDVRFYKFTPAATGMYTFSMCGSNGDTKMALAASCPSLSSTLASIAYNDDQCQCASGCGTTTQSNWSSELSTVNTGIPLTTELVAGNSYYLAIGSYSATSGVVYGTLTVAGPPQPPACPADFNHDGVVNGADLSSLLGVWGPCTGCPQDLNSDGVVNGADLSALLGAWGACPQ